jgi:sugar phosphate isomerase/epimerase
MQPRETDNRAPRASTSGVRGHRLARHGLAVALQMWTVREQMSLDPLGCLLDVADAGYDAVELVGYANAGFDAIRGGLASAGLRAISQHLPYHRFADELDRLIEEHKSLGCDYVVIQQGRHEDWVDADAVRAFADQANAWGAACCDAGLALGYHGYHELDQEFAPYGNATRWDLFAGLIDPELVFLQLDTYWVRRTGHDPVEMLERFAGRVPTLHLKDTARPQDGAARGATPPPTDGAVDDTTIGDGLLQLPVVLDAAARNGTRWVIVEQEGDPQHALRDIRRSRGNLLDALDRLP